MTDSGPDRVILEIGGSDRRKFLGGLVSRDAPADGNLAYSSLLTPQGKLIADFFLFERGHVICLDVAASLAPDLMRRLSMYKLRSDVTIAESGLKVMRGRKDSPEGALSDPRHPALGWRLYGDKSGDDGTDWDAVRVRHCIPETGTELTPDTYILEMGFERLGGVDFSKGCYVGQEVTARMKHKTSLRKGLAVVDIKGPADPGAEITADGKPIGRLGTRSGDRALAYLRFDKAEGELAAGQAIARLAPV